MLAVLYVAAGAIAWWRGLRAWGAWLLCWAPVVAAWAPDARAWILRVLVPLSIVGAVLLAAAALEAFWRYCRGFAYPVHLSAALGFLGASSGIAVLNYRYRPGSWISAALQVSLSVRVAVTVFLALAVAFMLSVGAGRIRSRDFAHLAAVFLMAGSFAGASLVLPHLGRYAWLGTDAAVQAFRAVLLTAWIAAVPNWRRAARRVPAASPAGPGAPRFAR